MFKLVGKWYVVNYLKWYRIVVNSCKLSKLYVNTLCIRLKEENIVSFSLYIISNIDISSLVRYSYIQKYRRYKSTLNLGLITLLKSWNNTRKLHWYP